MKKVIIFGTGEIGAIAHYYFTHDSEYIIEAFTVDDDFFKEEIYCDLPVIKFSEIEKVYPPEYFDMFIALSYSGLNTLRENKYLQSKEKGYTLVSYISSKATVWPDLLHGDNCFILENNTIQPFAKIGNNVTLWSGNHIGHHSEIGNNCFITSHVVISGGVKVDNNCFIGVNSTIRDHVHIGKSSIIGAGAWINKNTHDGEVYISKPTPHYNISINDIKI